MADTEARDRERFYEVHHLVRDLLAGFLARRAPADEVEDLFADTMVVVWRRVSDVPRGGEVAWTYGVARRVLANHRRGGARLRRLVERIGAAAEQAPAGLATGADPDLAAAVARLPPADAEILRLSAWEELAPREIALVLGISPNAASVRLLRARGRLRDLLEASASANQPSPGSLPVVERKDA